MTPQPKHGKHTNISNLVKGESVEFTYASQASTTLGWNIKIRGVVVSKGKKQVTILRDGLHRAYKIEHISDVQLLMK